MELAHAHKMKFLPVHHMEAHALVARQAVGVSFPFLCLLISGGHNMLIIAHGVGEYTLLGSTLDDALGESPFLVISQASAKPSSLPRRCLTTFKTY